MLEKSVEEHLTDRVEELGGMCEKFVSPGRRGPPDRLITWPLELQSWFTPAMELVELKRPGETLDEHQVRDHAKRIRRGVMVTVLDSIMAVDMWIKAKTDYARETRERP